ncbi:MAG: hypothetical protein WCK65_04675 [Rhodospirillaceae bacterium]
MIATSSVFELFQFKPPWFWLRANLLVVASIMVGHLLVVLLLLGTLAAWAETPKFEPSPQDQALQGLGLIMKGLRGMIEQVPLYGPPELAPNGDIILRRISPIQNPPGSRSAPATPPSLSPTPPTHITPAPPLPGSGLPM